MCTHTCISIYACIRSPEAPATLLSTCSQGREEVHGSESGFGFQQPRCLDDLHGSHEAAASPRFIWVAARELDLSYYMDIYIYIE